MKRVLVTGAAGFLGSHLVAHLFKCGISVCGVGHTGSVERLPSNVEFHELDICDSLDAFSSFAGQDKVIHTVARKLAYSSAERVEQERVNVDGTRNVIAACLHHHVRKLVHVSTTAAIGISKDPDTPANENFQFNLERFDIGYNSTKYRAEKLCFEANSEDLEVIIANPGFIFGADANNYVGASIIESARQKRFVTCTNGGLSIVHIDDVVNGIVALATNGRPGERYILSGQNLTFAEIARIIASKTRRKQTIIIIPDTIRTLMGIPLRLLSKFRGKSFPLHLDGCYAYQYFSSHYWTKHVFVKIRFKISVMIFCACPIVRMACLK